MRRGVVILVAAVAAIGILAGGLGWLLTDVRPPAGASRAERLFYAYCAECHGTVGEVPRPQQKERCPPGAPAVRPVALGAVGVVESFSARGAGRWARIREEPPQAAREDADRRNSRDEDHDAATHGDILRGTTGNTP